MKRSHAKLMLVGAALAAVLSPFAASPAHAAWDDCGISGNTCNFKNANGSSGGLKQFGGNDSNYSDNNFSGCSLNCNVNDATSSVRNRESYTVRFFYDSSGGGAAWEAGSGAQVNVPSFYNDELTSHQGV